MEEKKNAPTKDLIEEAEKLRFFSGEILSEEILASKEMLQDYIQRNKAKLNEKNIVLSKSNDSKNVSSLNFYRIEGLYIFLPLVLLTLFYGFILTMDNIYAFLTVVFSIIVSFTVLTIAMGWHVYKNREIYFTQGIPLRPIFSVLLIIGTYFAMVWIFKFEDIPLSLILIDLISHIGNLKEFNALFTQLILNGEFKLIDLKLSWLSLMGALLIYSVSQTYGWWIFLRRRIK